MAGYCNDSQNTSQVLVTSIYNKNEIAYKTGDFVTIDKDKNYIFVGRKDDMVKLNGRLIYLSEIEGVILKDKRVVNAFAITESIDDQVSDIILIIAINEKTDLTIYDVKNIILHNLPSYMLPSKIYLINEDEIPKNNVDKIDRKKLYENIKLKIQ
jgi:acyl-CoA synthetase (AMP-forming)/AMP-acid ligase II